VAECDFAVQVKHFELSDAQKFEEVWQMKEQDVQELLSVLLTADKVIAEQQLGYLWFPPGHEALQQKFEEGKRRALAAGKKRNEVGVGEDDILQLTAASSEKVQEVRAAHSPFFPPPYNVTRPLSGPEASSGRVRVPHRRQGGCSCHSQSVTSSSH
jgi:hypothetical protein